MFQLGELLILSNSQNISYNGAQIWVEGGTIWSVISVSRVPWMVEIWFDGIVLGIEGGTIRMGNFGEFRCKFCSKIGTRVVEFYMKFM